MAAPQINPYFDYLVLTQGQYFARRVPAPGATAWNATGLPTGLTIDNSGNISGIPTVAQSTVATCTPSNGDGDGEPLRISFEVRPATAMAASGAPRIVMDLDTRDVFRRGGKPGEVIYFGRTGNAGAVEVFFERSGVPEPWRPKQIAIVAKRYEPDAKRFDLTPSPADVRYLGTDASSACEVRVSFANTGLRTLTAEHEEDVSSGFNATAQLVFVGPDATPGELSEPVEANAGLTLNIPGYVPLGDHESANITVPGLTAPGWYQVRVELEETDFGDGAIFGIYYVEVASSGSGLTVKSVEYNDEDSETTGVGTGSKTGINMAVGIEGGTGKIRFESGNLIIPVSVSIWAVFGTGSTALTPTATAIVEAATFDIYDAESDEWASKPFLLRVERNLSPAS